MTISSQNGLPNEEKQTHKKPRTGIILPNNKYTDQYTNGRNKGRGITPSPPLSSLLAFYPPPPHSPPLPHPSPSSPLSISWSNVNKRASSNIDSVSFFLPFPFHSFFVCPAFSGLCLSLGRRFIPPSAFRCSRRGFAVSICCLSRSL